MIAAAVALLMLASPAPGDPGTITLFRTQSVCAGFCPDMQFTVHPDGLVIAMIESGTFQFRVAPEYVAEFRAILASSLGVGARLVSRDCEEGDRASALDIHPQLRTFISWSSIPASPLSGCLTAATSRLLASLEQEVAGALDGR